MKIVTVFLLFLVILSIQYNKTNYFYHNLSIQYIEFSKS